jgi:hypothetical protein
VIGIPERPKVTIDDAKRCVGQPVCVVMHDGSYYLGWITDVEKDDFILSGHKGRNKMSRSAIQHADKARVAGFFPDMSALDFGGGWGAAPFSFAPGGGGAPPNGGVQAPGNAGGGWMGMLGKAWPGIRMGIGMVQTLMPLLGGFKI